MTRIHISLPARDLARSVDFYTRMLGAPDKLRDDYARYQPADAPLTLAINAVATAPSPDSGPRHVGLKLPDATAVEAWLQRLEEAGLEGLPDDGVCCYADQRKAWFVDPDGHRWEIYAVLADADEAGKSAVVCCDDPAESGSCCPPALKAPSSGCCK